MCRLGQTVANACVVDTGSPVRDANSTQVNAPVATESGKSDDSATSPVTRPVLKVRSSAVVNTSAATDPATVQPVPHDSPWR